MAIHPSHQQPADPRPRPAPPSPRGRAWPEAWRHAVRLARAGDRATHHLPAGERDVLGARLRRAARAVAAQLAAGHDCTRPAERAFHLAVARGSLGEVETCVRQACRRGLLPAEPLELLTTRCADVRRALGEIAVLAWCDA